jgi:hypothetical protein
MRLRSRIIDPTGGMGTGNLYRWSGSVAMKNPSGKRVRDYGPEDFAKHQRTIYDVYLVAQK